MSCDGVVSVILFESASCCISPDFFVLCEYVTILCYIGVMFRSGALSHFLPLFLGIKWSVLVLFIMFLWCMW